MKQKEQQTKDNKDSSLVNQGSKPPQDSDTMQQQAKVSIPKSKKKQTWKPTGNSVNMSPLPVPNSKEDASGLVPHQTTQAFSGTI